MSVKNPVFDYFQNPSKTEKSSQIILEISLQTIYHFFEFHTELKYKMLVY